MAGHLLGELQLSGSSSITTFFLTDGLGSVLGVFSNTASSAALLSTQLVANGNSIGQYTAKGFTGQYADAVSGLEYYVSRYYDPVAGVFLAADKATGNAQGMNPYGYVGNNPETETDPTGQMVCFIGCGGSAGGSGGNGGGTGGSGSGGSSPSGSSPSTLLPPPSCAQLWGCKTGAWQEGSTTSSVDVSSTSGLLTPTCGTLGGFSGPSICVPGLTAVGVPHRLFYRTSVAVPVTLCVPTLVCMDETGGAGATEDATTSSGELVGDRWYATDSTGDATGPSPISADEQEAARAEIDNLELQRLSARPRPAVLGKAVTDGQQPLEEASGQPFDYIDGFEATKYNDENGGGACAEFHICAEVVQNQAWWEKNINIYLASRGLPPCPSCENVFQWTANTTGSTFNVYWLDNIRTLMSQTWGSQP